ncbi:hypothetical protein HK14_02420 [Acetobacter cibinongensis]|uniref:Uncharacterized protein n=2 Tax=Acetobacter cibinongensis TaxID=146475 RepID=A0A1Z5YWD0_9PROT|nr:hypothetical protein HK14_02420 [Acetobacter cibinongensis]
MGGQLTDCLFFKSTDYLNYSEANNVCQMTEKVMLAVTAVVENSMGSALKMASDSFPIIHAGAEGRKFVPADTARRGYVV